MIKLARKVYNIINHKTCTDNEAKKQKITLILDGKHPADISDLIEDLDSESRLKFFKLTPEFVDCRVLIHLVNPYRTKTIAFFGLKYFKNSLHLLTKEELIELVERLNVKERNKLVELMPSKLQSIVKFLKTYPENSVGRNMSFDFTLMKETISVEEAITYIKTHKEIPDSCSEIFIENDEHQLTGLISLTRLLQSEKKKKLKDIESPDIIAIKSTDDQEVAHNMFNKYHFVRIPVVDNNNHMIGLIRAADLIDIAQEEITEDFTKLAGTGFVNSEEPLSIPIVSSCIQRLSWLSIAIINALLSPLIIAMFQETIQKIVSLAVLMPIAGALGGNIGIQTASIIIKSLATSKLREGFYGKIIRNETFIGILNGLIIGCLLGIISLLSFHDWKLSSVLCGAMTFCATWASLLGVLLPLISYKFGFDSSLSSGPLITTVSDVSGYVVFLGLARACL